jgi:predicted amidophosphoribosyltransferase
VAGAATLAASHRPPRLLLESLYFRRMTVQCQKCGKDYEPKRRGGKFCSVSCRVVQHQLVKKGQAWPNPPNGDERYLAEKLVAVGRSATEALVQVEGLPAAEAFGRLRALVQGWAGVAHNSIIEKVQYNEQQEMNAQATRMKRLKGSK